MHTLFCVIFALLTAAEFFTSWHVYATAAAGAGALSLLQNALQAGSLVASRADLEIPRLLPRPRRWLPSCPDGTVTT